MIQCVHESAILCFFVWGSLVGKRFLLSSPLTPQSFWAFTAPDEGDR